MNIPVTDIKVKSGRRAISSDKVRELSASMADIGLINPITVTPDFVLVTGAHRLEAAKTLGWDTITANLFDGDEFALELAEIDENLMRHELHYIDRGNAIKRRDELLTEMGMRWTSGLNQHTSGCAESAPPKTSQEIASDLGMSKRAMQVEKQIATNILPEVQDTIKEADLPKRDALKIARMEPEQQVKVAEKLSDGAKSLVDAQRLIKREEVHSTPELSGKYRVIYADPPWSYGDKSPAYHGTVENHYPTMSLAEICDLPVLVLVGYIRVYPVAMSASLLHFARCGFCDGFIGCFLPTHSPPSYSTFRQPDAFVASNPCQRTRRIYRLSRTPSILGLRLFHTPSKWGLPFRKTDTVSGAGRPLAGLV